MPDLRGVPPCSGVQRACQDLSAQRTPLQEGAIRSEPATKMAKGVAHRGGEWGYNTQQALHGWDDEFTASFSCGRPIGYRGDERRRADRGLRVSCRSTPCQTVGGRHSIAQQTAPWRHLQNLESESSPNGFLATARCRPPTEGLVSATARRAFGRWAAAPHWVCQATDEARDKRRSVNTAAGSACASTAATWGAGDTPGSRSCCRGCRNPCCAAWASAPASRRATPPRTQHRRLRHEVGRQHPRADPVFD